MVDLPPLPPIELEASTLLIFCNVFRQIQLGEQVSLVSKQVQMRKTNLTQLGEQASSNKQYKSN